LIANPSKLNFYGLNLMRSLTQNNMALRPKKSKELNALGIYNGFFGISGGHSTGLFNSLNCSIKCKDDKANVTKNLSKIADYFAKHPNNLKSLNQNHTYKVVTVNDVTQMTSNIEADALVTNKPGIILGVYTADCTPILFADAKNRVIGATHAGWRGAVGEIIENTIKAMLDLGAKHNSITACIGPCIQQTSYEVDNSFKIQFLEKSESYDKFFIPSSRTNHYMFDLPGFCESKLLKFGISKVENLKIDTYPEENLFFSCRRAFHHKQEAFGCQMSAICL